MNAVTEMSLLTFTDNAANKVRELIEEEGNADLKLLSLIHISEPTRPY